MSKKKPLMRIISLVSFSVLVFGAGSCFAADSSDTAAEEELSAECIKMRQDLDANLAEQNKKGCPPSTAQMARLMDNPLGNVAMFINQVDFYQMEEPQTGINETKSGYTGILQFPKGLGENWNIINRIVFTVPSMPLDQDKIDDFNQTATARQQYGEGQGPILPPTEVNNILPVQAFDGRTTGFGDMYYVGLVSPKEPIRHGGGAISAWGLGADLMLPTASEDVLGTGRWAGGPSALYAYMGPTWKLGALWQQYWSFDSNDDRDDVNLTNLQYFVYYTINDTMSIGAGPNIIANWELDSDDRWTVPIGLGINKTINIGPIPVRFAVEAHYSVIKPDNVVGAEWDLRFMIIPAAPSFLFSWMQ